MDALKNASNIVNESRTSLLSPKNYFALCLFFSFFSKLSQDMVAFDELKHLEGVLYDDREKFGKKIRAL